MLILEDVQRDLPENASEIPPLYNNDTLELKAQVKSMERQLFRYKRLKNRIGTLFLAWSIGEIIETKSSTPTERTYLINLLTPYYRVVVIRLYYLFEFSGLKGLANSRNITLAMATKLKQKEFDSLTQEALIFAGARNLGGETVTE